MFQLSTIFVISYFWTSVFYFHREDLEFLILVSESYSFASFFPFPFRFSSFLAPVPFSGAHGLMVFWPPVLSCPLFSPFFLAHSLLLRLTVSSMVSSFMARTPAPSWHHLGFWRPTWPLRLHSCVLGTRILTPEELLGLPVRPCISEPVRTRGAQKRFCFSCNFPPLPPLAGAGHGHRAAFLPVGSGMNRALSSPDTFTSSEAKMINGICLIVLKSLYEAGFLLSLLILRFSFQMCLSC